MPRTASILELKPNRRQIWLFRQACGCARLAYNWALDHWPKTGKQYGNHIWMPLQKQFVALVRTEMQYMRAIPSGAYYQPFRHLNEAFKRYAKGLGCHPKYKAKLHCRACFK